MDDDGHQIGYLALPKGTPVHTSDGALLGTVFKVQDNAREHIFDGLVVKTPAGNVFVDAPEVVRITERRVTLSIDAAEARDLKPPPGMRGTVEKHAKRTGRRWKRWFGR
jgi:hypothetical protein